MVEEGNLSRTYSEQLLDGVGGRKRFIHDDVLRGAARALEAQAEEIARLRSLLPRNHGEEIDAALAQRDREREEANARGKVETARRDLLAAVEAFIAAKGISPMSEESVSIRGAVSAISGADDEPVNAGSPEVSKQANGRYTLRDCPGYSPDLEAMGDCYNCGHVQSSHRGRSVVPSAKRYFHQAMDPTIESVSLYGVNDLQMNEDDLRLALRWVMRNYLRKIDPMVRDDAPSREVYVTPVDRFDESGKDEDRFSWPPFKAGDVDF